MDFSMLNSKYIVMVYCIIVMYTNKYSNTVEAAGNSAAVDRIISYSVNMDPKDISSKWRKSKYTLTGLGVNDGAELMRILLKSLGVNFEYIQLSDDDWKSLNSEILVGRTPFLEIDGKVLFAQPIAACRYLANLAGLHGKNDQDNVVIDSYMEDIIEWHSEVFSYHYDTDETTREKKRSELMKTTLQYVRLFEYIVSENDTGYIFSNKLSWVDLAYICTLNFIKMSTNYDVRPRNNKALTELSRKVSEFVRDIDGK